MILSLFVPSDLKKYVYHLGIIQMIIAGVVLMRWLVYVESHIEDSEAIPFFYGLFIALPITGAMFYAGAKGGDARMIFGWILFVFVYTFLGGWWVMQKFQENQIEIFEFGFSMTFVFITHLIELDAFALCFQMRREQM